MVDFYTHGPAGSQARSHLPREGACFVGLAVSGRAFVDSLRGWLEAVFEGAKSAAGVRGCGAAPLLLALHQSIHCRQQRRDVEPGL